MAFAQRWCCVNTNRAQAVFQQMEQGGRILATLDGCRSAPARHGGLHDRRSRHRRWRRCS